MAASMCSLFHIPNKTGLSYPDCSSGSLNHLGYLVALRWSLKFLRDGIFVIIATYARRVSVRKVIPGLFLSPLWGNCDLRCRSTTQIKVNRRSDD